MCEEARKRSVQAAEADADRSRPTRPRREKHLWPAERLPWLPAGLGSGSSPGTPLPRSSGEQALSDRPPFRIAGLVPGERFQGAPRRVCRQACLRPEARARHQVRSARDPDPPFGVGRLEMSPALPSPLSTRTQELEYRESVAWWLHGPSKDALTTVTHGSRELLHIESRRCS